MPDFFGLYLVVLRYRPKFLPRYGQKKFFGLYGAVWRCGGVSKVRTAAALPSYPEDYFEFFGQRL